MSPHAPLTTNPTPSFFFSARLHQPPEKPWLVIAVKLGAAVETGCESAPG